MGNKKKDISKCCYPDCFHCAYPDCVISTMPKKTKEMKSMKEIKIGQKIYLDGKEIGEIAESPDKGRFMIKRYDSKWKIDFYFFCLINPGNIEIK